MTDTLATNPQVENIKSNTRTLYIIIGIIIAGAIVYDMTRGKKRR